tara:strand:+ start:797 stop:988 length:192 start_codon:yes stop_codon:yes gene_type:complete
MANFRIEFQDEKDPQTTIECFANADKTITIVIESNTIASVNLDVSTSIKLAKHLRCEINKTKG